MFDTKEEILQQVDHVRDERLQLMLMKMVAEQNQEKFFEYDCATDVGVLATISNGEFVTQEIMTNFVHEGNQLYGRVAEEDRDLYRRELQRCMRKPMSRVFEIRYLNEKGEKIWHRVFLVSLADENRKVVRLAARLLSIHKEKSAAEFLRMQAERDSLTGVYNHKTYENMSRDMIRKNSDGILFLMVDIDNFKLINDTNGHHAGDSIIKQVGEVLSLAVKEFGIAGRTGGDEFSVCLANIWNKETAAEVCIRIKDALKCSKEGVDFSVSIGAARSRGRICTFDELYFEADEALYFVKENGKNQIVFSEDLAQKQQELLEERKNESSMTEEEIELDEKLEYSVIVDPTTKRILYMNKQARNLLGMTLEEAQQMCCYELLKGRCKECDVCELYTSQVRALNSEEAVRLNEYVPDGKFVLQSRYSTWHGEPARQISFLDLNDGKHIERCFKQELESQQTINRCWNIIHDTDMQDVDYAKVLRVLNEYYDADCSAIISKDGERYKDVFEYHRESAAAVAEGVEASLVDGVFEKMEVLIDEEGYMRPRHIEQRLMENMELIPELEKRLVHSAVGIKLARKDLFVGVLLIINPRHHIDDYHILKLIGIFFTTDLLRKNLSDTKNYEVTHDMLTRLWNRAYFGEWTAKYGHLFHKNFGVFTADIFHLGDVNKQLGYEHGNDMILQVTSVFKKVFAGFAVFRYDAGQILAICHNTDKVTFQKMVNYAQELMEEVDVEVSIGYAWTVDGDLADVLREAQEYLEKDRARLDIHNDAEGKLFKHIERGVEEEIAKGNFKVYLQPKVSLITGKTVGAEALIRLFNDVRGIVSPAFFIPLLEERGAVHFIDLFVLEETLRFQYEALKAGKEVVPISVNFSKNTLIYVDLIERIKELYERYPIPNGLIEIEITETISSMDHIVVNNIATSLRNMGFSISMDDFGTKYSNMALLTRFEFDTVKVDRSLLLDVENNKKNELILKHTLEMLQELGIKTVMEGVETQEQADILRAFGCEIAQGYFYGKPEPNEKFYELFME